MTSFKINGEEDKTGAQRINGAHVREMFSKASLVRVGRRKSLKGTKTLQVTMVQGKEPRGVSADGLEDTK